MSRLASRLGWALAILFGIARPVPTLAPSSTDTLVSQWNAVALQAVRDTHPGPPICARELAIVNTCMYDAWAAYDAKAVGTRKGGDLRRPAAEQTLANKDE